MTARPEPRANVVHVTPVGDLIEHETLGDDCVCQPTPRLVACADGSDGWVMTHHSLDGRELNEPDYSP